MVGLNSCKQVAPSCRLSHHLDALLRFYLYPSAQNLCLPLNYSVSLPCMTNSVGAMPNSIPTASPCLDDGTAELVSAACRTWTIDIEAAGMMCGYPFA